MADDQKNKEEEVDSQVEPSEEEDDGLAEALGLGDDEESDASEDDASEDTTSVEEQSAQEDESFEDEPAEPDTAEESEDDPDEAEAAFVAPAPKEEEEDEDDWPLDEESSVPAVIVSDTSHDASADGLAAYFDDPNELLHAAEEARDEGFKVWDAFSPFPIHGIEDAMGIGRSWLPWVTFGAGGTGFLLANALQFGTSTFDWPMIIGGKPHAPWPSFVPIMFELTVLIGGVTSALVMFIASGCFRKPRIIDPEITNDRFVLWIDSKDPKYGQAREFMAKLDPVEIRTVTF
jgi:hypothetical protein